MKRAKRADRVFALFQFLRVVVLLRGRCGRDVFGAFALYFRRLQELLLEAVDTPFGVNQLLAAREERVAAGANFHTQVTLMRGSGLKRMPARARDFYEVISGVDAVFHLFFLNHFTLTHAPLPR
jgi:hypothetical protein